MSWWRSGSSLTLQPHGRMSWRLWGSFLMWSLPKPSRMCHVSKVNHTHLGAMYITGKCSTLLFSDLELSTLVEHLHTISNWYLLGIYLRIPDTKLDQIRQECPCSTTDCLLKMLQFWLHNGSNISWSSLGEAMAKMPDVVCAQNVEQQYQSSLV